jgi:hypothetical protein
LTTFSILLLTFLMQQCYYDSKEFLFPEVGNTCDTTNVTYTASVVPVLDQYCLGCHNNTSASSAGGNIKLENYPDVKTVADNGKLMGSVTHSSGFSWMPKGSSSKINDCSITILQIWVDSGAPNN